MAWTKAKIAFAASAAAFLAAGMVTVVVKEYVVPELVAPHRLRAALHTLPQDNSGYDSARIDSALRAYGNRKEAAFPILKQATENTRLHLVGTVFLDTNLFIRLGAFYGMGQIGKSVPEVQPYLWSVALSSPGADVVSQRSRQSAFMNRLSAYMALRQIDFLPSDMPNLIKLLSDPTVSDGILLLLVPEKISDLIESNSLEVASNVPEIKDLLDDPDPDTQVQAALALLRSEGSDDPRIFSALHALFQRPKSRLNDYDQMIAVQVLGNAGPVARPLIPDLLKFSKMAGDPGEKQMAYEAMARIEPDLASQIPEVADALKRQQERSGHGPGR